MRSHDRAVQQKIFHIWVIGEMLMHIFPYLVFAPARKAFVNAVPVPLVFRKQSSLGPTAQDPQDSFHELPALCFLPSIGPRVAL
jgi:hypothetical protein